MIPIDQTRFSAPDGSVHGNCFSACLASILECSIDEVPDFSSMDEEWFQPFHRFIHERGYDFGGMYGNGDIDWQVVPCVGIDGYYIVGGPSHREYVTRGHAVVYKDGAMVHDPHPSRAGLREAKYVYMIDKGEQ